MTKIIFAITGAALILTTPALAAQSHHSGITTSAGPTYPHLIVQGRDVGTDPSELVRLDLMRDPAGGQ